MHDICQYSREHVAEAERNNRVIKEQLLSTYHRLPFQQLPKIMVKILVLDSAKKLSFLMLKMAFRLVIVDE
jgi:hypothetical protein